MHFDDLQLLKSIDEYEQTATAYIFNGFALVQAISGRTVLENPNDYQEFAHELLLARKAGYLTFEEQIWAGNLPLDPKLEAHQWLQRIDEIRLTSAGRDRAHGLVIIQPLPDPNDDDRRPIASMTLEDVARAIGTTYSVDQLPRFLTDSRIPQSYHPPVDDGAPWAYLLALLHNLEAGGSAARRVLREFLGAWLEGRLHSRPTADSRQEILRQLNQQGWHLREGRLVVGAVSTGEPEPPEPGSRADRIARLHPIIRDIAAQYPEQLEVAVLEAFKALSPRARDLSGLSLDGKALMGKAFADDGPLRIGDPRAETEGSSIQEGYRFLFLGSVLGIRNPTAHEPLVALTEDEAFEQLGFASLLMRQLDHVKKVLAAEGGEAAPA